MGKKHIAPPSPPKEERIVGGRFRPQYNKPARVTIGGFIDLGHSVLTLQRLLEVDAQVAEQFGPGSAQHQHFRRALSSRRAAFLLSKEG